MRTVRPGRGDGAVTAIHRLLLPAAVACAAVAGAAASTAPGTVAFAAAPEHRAVVIVDTGQEVRRVCVRFAEDFLTGQELLIRASTDPVFRQYPGLGAAVCALCGVGCPADESCLTCGGDTYWTYSRAARGTGEFKVSGAGASSTKVYDGDVEGWRWSKGLLPAYASVDQVCGPAPGATTTSSSAGTATTAGAAASPATTTTSGRRATTTTVEVSRLAAPLAEATTTTATDAQPTTTTTTTAGNPDDDEEQSAPPTVPSSNAGGGSAASLAAFAAVLAGFLGWAVWLRRARRRAVSIVEDQ